MVRTWRGIHRCRLQFTPPTAFAGAASHHRVTEARREGSNHWKQRRAFEGSQVPALRLTQFRYQDCGSDGE